MGDGKKKVRRRKSEITSTRISVCGAWLLWGSAAKPVSGARNFYIELKQHLHPLPRTTARRRVLLLVLLFLVTWSFT